MENKSYSRKVIAYADNKQLSKNILSIGIIIVVAIVAITSNLIDIIQKEGSNYFLIIVPFIVIIASIIKIINTFTKKNQNRIVNDELIVIEDCNIIFFDKKYITIPINDIKKITVQEQIGTLVSGTIYFTTETAEYSVKNIKDVKTAYHTLQEYFDKEVFVEDNTDFFNTINNTENDENRENINDENPQTYIQKTTEDISVKEEKEDNLDEKAKKEKTSKDKYAFDESLFDIDNYDVEKGWSKKDK